MFGRNRIPIRLGMIMLMANITTEALSDAASGIPNIEKK
jgi:hypothetical protein